MLRLISACLLLCSFFSQSQEQAEAIFDQLAPSLYQIKIIDLASGEKSSIGSGFQISEEGIIGTNYHVISSYARFPEKFSMQYVDHLGSIGELSLLSVDVINDLALVKRDVAEPMAYFEISESAPKKGEELYSLGNPHDLGMIVVPGTYNGLKTESFNDKIHFTGSVNPGMSGGPVVNRASEVVGVNVATSGNQIGFLVPHDKLVNLFNKFKVNPPETIKAQMAEQLFDYQNDLINQLLSAEWQLKELGEGVIPTINVPFVRCWGNSNADKEKALFLAAVANCMLDDDIFIQRTFGTGSVEMEFRYLQAKDISDTKFYNLYQQQIRRAGPSNKVGKDDATEYQCQHDIVSPESTEITNKAILCTRAYKDFAGLYDILFLSASVDQGNQALISHFTLAGVSKQNAQAFTEKFIEAVSWNQ